MTCGFVYLFARLQTPIEYREKDLNKIVSYCFLISYIRIQEMLPTKLLHKCLVTLQNRHE
jgi:hypothetical protein